MNVSKNSLKSVSDVLSWILQEKFDFINRVFFNYYVTDSYETILTLCVETTDKKISTKLDNINTLDSSHLFETTQDRWYYLSVHEDIMTTIVSSIKYIVGFKAHEYGVRFV